jgi:hypothetical protein
MKVNVKDRDFHEYWIYPNISVYFTAIENGGMGRCLVYIKVPFYVNVQMWFRNFYKLHVAAVACLKPHMYTYSNTFLRRFWKFQENMAS